MNQPARLPVVTVSLVAINIVVAFLAFLDPQLLETWGFVPGETAWYRMPVSLFLHANTVHLLGNMLFLAAVGVAVELASGTVRFLLVYLGSGFIGVIAYSFAVRGLLSAPMLIGASGCIAGCAGYYSLRFMQFRVPIAPKLGASVAVITGLWFLLQIIGAFVTLGGAVSATAFIAHGGGFVAGLLLSLIFKAPDIGDRSLGHLVLDQMNDRGPDVQIGLAQAHLEQHPGDIRALKRLAEGHRLLGNHEEELDALLEILPTAEDTEELEIVQRLSHPALRSRQDLISRIRLAEKLALSVGTEAAELIGDVWNLSWDTPYRPDGLLTLAGIYHAVDRPQSEQALSILIKEYPKSNATDLARSRGWI